MTAEDLPAPLSSGRRGRAAVVDIGSNSLRLVVYDGVGPAPFALFNEKVMCGLGRGLGATGRLNPEGVALALVNLRRFVGLARAIGVARLDVLATAAVRDAADGRDFVAEVERRYRVRVQVLPGAEEGRLSAFGVIAAIPEASGVVGDLGGGSVELVTVADRRPGAAVTLPIGPLRLAEFETDERRTRETIDRHIGEVAWLRQKRGATFYAVGGAWRALARIHMEQTRYPIHVIQSYTLSRAEAEAFLQVVARQSRKSLEKITTVSRKRLEVVPLAANILWRLMRVVEPERLVFSAFGLREGHLYSLLDDAQRRADPLLVACAAMARAQRRFGAEGREYFDWTAALFPEEGDGRRRLRLAAALLSDIAWAEHPDYRAEQAFRRCLYMPVAGLDHRERAFLAMALHARYGGNEAAVRETTRRVLSEEDAGAARVCGLALRLGYTLTGGVRGLLPRTRLMLEGESVTLTLPEEGVLYFGESVQRRLDALGRAMNRRTAVVPRPPAGLPPSEAAPPARRVGK